MTKEEIRKQMRSRRQSHDGTEDSRQMMRQIWQSRLYREAESVFFYAAFRNEPDFELLRQQACREGQRVALPRILGPGCMRFYVAERPEQWEVNTWGIPEPPLLEELTASERTIVLVPGLAFDRTGGRIGYGGGYYDRFLQQHPRCRTEGAAYSFQVLEALPLEESDQRLEYLVTPQALIQTEACRTPAEDGRA